MSESSMTNRENTVSVLDASAPTGSGSGVTSAVQAGQVLRDLREKQGLHIAALAVALKVPVKKLEQLESGELGKTVDPVFVRALASSVCRHLKADPQNVLSLLPQVNAPRLMEADEGINAPFAVAGVSTSGGWRDWAYSKTSWLVATIMALAAIVYFSPAIEAWFNSYDWWFQHGAETAQEVSVGVVSAADNAQLNQGPIQEQISPPAPGTPSEPEANAVPVSTQDAAVSQSGSTSPISEMPPDVLVFKASGTTWVEVRDGAGKVLSSRTLQAGETLALSGVYPLSVVVGKADVTEVLVHGKPYSLKALTKDDVARFEVKS